jgi:hypothetical protein
MVKAMIAQVTKECSIPQQDIMHRISLLEGKFEAVCQVVLGLELRFLRLMKTMSLHIQRKTSMTQLTLNTTQFTSIMTPNLWPQLKKKKGWSTSKWTNP